MSDPARQALPGLVVGTLFGAGLTVSGMTDPARVLGFLDITGAWDPTLAVVLAAALIPSAFAYWLLRRMDAPMLADEFCIPRNLTVEWRLILGAALFGIGWGLVGLCPGPALAGLALGGWQSWAFVVAMIAGMALHRASGSAADSRKRSAGKERLQ